MTKRTKRLIMIGVVALVATGLALPKILSEEEPSGPGSGKGGGGGKGGPGGGGPVSVNAIVVGGDEVSDEIRVTGTLLPNEQVDLQSEISGKITGFYFNEGEYVGKGALLVKINDDELRAQLKRATVQKELAAANEARAKKLVERNAVSPADYEVALGELNAANAEIALIQVQIAKTEIRAPFSGVMGFRQVSLGSYIAPSTKIVTLSSTNPVKIEFYVPERYKSMLRPGDNIFFSIAGEEATLPARVFAIEPRVDATTRTLQIRATASNPGGRLFPGTFAQIILRRGTREASLTVPSEAVIPQAGGKSTVYVAVNGKAEPRPVDIGVRSERNVQILTGLTPGDTVIYSGTQMLKPGGSVIVAVVEGVPVIPSIDDGA